MPILSANLLSIALLTQTKKIVEFLLDRFIVEDLRLTGETIASGYLDPKDGLYKFFYSPKLTGPTALIAHIDVRRRIWHEQLRHSNFQSLKMMVTNNMVNGLPNTIPCTRACKGCVLGKHH